MDVLVVCIFFIQRAKITIKLGMSFILPEKCVGRDIKGGKISCFGEL